MGLTTIIKMLLEDMTFKKSSADLKREFLLQKENAEKAFNSKQVTQTSFSVIDACKYLIEECIPQGKADLYCCIQTKYDRKTATLTPSGSYAKELAILQNQKDNDVKIVKKAKQRLLKDTYFKIEEQRRNKVLHETYTIVGYTDEKEYADKWGRSSINPIANKSDDELARIWETIQYGDKRESLSIRIPWKGGNAESELISKIIKFGNPFLQYGKAPLLYKIMLRRSKKDILISREAAKILTEFDAVLAVAAESPESLDLSKPRQLELIQQALIVKEELGLDFIPVLKNGTTWKSIEDMENATHDEKLEYQGESIDLMNAVSMAKEQTSGGGDSILGKMERNREQKEQMRAMSNQTNALIDAQLAQLKLQMADLKRQALSIPFGSIEWGNLNSAQAQLQRDIAKLEAMKK